MLDQTTPTSTTRATATTSGDDSTKRSPVAAVSRVHIEAALWIFQLPTTRGGALAEGDKILLVQMWSHAPLELRSDASHKKVYPSRARLMASTGATLPALKERIDRLAKAGWIRRRGRGWDLAWMIPFTACEESVPTASQPEEERQESATTAYQPAAGVGSNRQQESVPTAGHLKNAGKNAIEEFKNADLDHVEIAGRAPDTPKPASPAESASRPGGRVGVTQQSLFADEPSKPTGPTRDPAQEVFDYLAARIVAAKIDLGIKPAIGPRVLGKTERRNIEDRIREHGKQPSGAIDFDLGIEACKRVIDVDEADCIRVREISQYWNASTPFRNAANFEGRLMRWRESGEHQIWGSKPAKGPKPRTDHGFDAYKPDEDFIDATGELCMGRNSMLAAVEWK